MNFIIIAYIFSGLFFVSSTALARVQCDQIFLDQNYKIEILAKESFAMQLPSDLNSQDSLVHFVSKYPYFYQGNTPHFQTYQLEDTIPAYEEFLKYKESVLVQVTSQ